MVIISLDFIQHKVLLSSSFMFSLYSRLDENYEMIPGACLPRSVLYTHYQDFCKRNLVEPSSAASFGKVATSPYMITNRRSALIIISVNMLLLALERSLAVILAILLNVKIY